VKFTSEVTEMGVSERGFTIDVDGETVPGLIWAPEGAKGPRPLVLMGHGGTQNKRTEGILARARSYVRHHAYAVVAIDAPGHGDRITPEEQARATERIRGRIAGRVQERSPEEMRDMAGRTLRAIPEWKATLEAVQKLDYVGEGPVGYWGVSMGTAIGVPFVASEPRIRAAVFGLAGLRPGAEAMEAAARSITIPILFVFQWDDELASREGGLALFDAFGSKEKTMHINPGGHLGIPAFERESYERFYLRHLGSGKDRAD
jgi:pimeloyl-ACP methyl ester carboxylesterase